MFWPSRPYWVLAYSKIRYVLSDPNSRLHRLTFPGFSDPPLKPDLPRTLRSGGATQISEAFLRCTYLDSGLHLRFGIRDLSISDYLT